MEEDDTIVLELTPREAAVIRRLACFFAWDTGDFAHEMRSVFQALSEGNILELIDHIHVCVRYRDTNRLMAVNALMIDDVSSHRVIRIAE